MNLISPQEIEDSFLELDLDIDSRDYIRFHKYRYSYLLHHISKIINSFSETDVVKILDVGPAFQTLLLRKYFPDTLINTLGFNHRTNILRKGEQHYRLDLNESGTKWNNHVYKHNIIIYCEVIEHLYTNPEIILNRFNEILEEGSKIIIQTPNAVAIHKRLRMAIGKNPYQQLQKDRMGHFREYTGTELIEMLSNCRFGNIKLSYKNYFNYDRNVFDRTFRKLEPFLPHQWRDGITVTASKI